MGMFIDLTNMQFGRLTVMCRDTSNTYTKESMWICKCSCGRQITTRGSSLRNGASKSCGCTRKDHLKNQCYRLTHGGSSERLYKVWRGMMDRCYYPSNIRYNQYGGRGISICLDWHDYAKFREWAFYNGYDEFAERGKCTIDRIDVNGNYEPSNCRWVDMKFQASNKRERKLF